jgi:hypothetical protein
MIELRSFTWIDVLQTQVAGFLGTVCAGDPPLPGDAALFIEVSPGMEINRVLDATLKDTACVPGLFVVERRFGVLQLHHRDHAQVREAGLRALRHLGVREEERMAPKITTNERITGVDPHQAQVINRMRHGNMQNPMDTLYVLETAPAGYALLAANEAEKAAEVDILEFRAIGAFGRVYLGGDDQSIRVAAEAAVGALRSLDGRRPE